ncbi:MAG: hypothetical protein KBT06_03040 [Prevotellaceae bacterium]|nr:hypothetical protein [Candidatus Colivivens equi]
MSLASNDLLNDVQEEQEQEGGRLAIIESTTTDKDNICRAKVKFYGEEEASNLEIPVLYASEPAVGDVVVIQKAGDSLVVAGKLKKEPKVDISSLQSAINSLTSKVSTLETNYSTLKNKTDEIKIKNVETELRYNNTSIGSIAAGSEKVISLSVSLSGYTFMGVRGLGVGSSASNYKITGFYLNGSTLYVHVYNPTTSTISNGYLYYNFSYIKIS